MASWLTMQAWDGRKQALPGATITFVRPGSMPPDPVQALKVLPDGPIFWLDACQRQGQRSQWISVGAHRDRDVVIDEPTVSAAHGFLFRERETGRLYVADARSKNGVFVNQVRVLDGLVELASGSLLSLGAVLLLACGRLGESQRPAVSGSNLHEFLDRAAAVYGSQRLAAQALHIKRSTLRDWLASKRFAPPGQSER